MSFEPDVNLQNNDISITRYVFCKTIELITLYTLHSTAWTEGNLRLLHE